MSAESEKFWTKVEIDSTIVKDLFKQMDGRHKLPDRECLTATVMFIKTEGELQLFVHNTAARQLNLMGNVDAPNP